MHTIGSGGRLTQCSWRSSRAPASRTAAPTRARRSTRSSARYAQRQGRCWQDGGQGGPLDGVGGKRDAKWLKAYLADPKSQMPDAKMPKMKLSDQQLDDLVAFLLTLK
jgi:cbb3-type cytochrome oxidase cytochrome c subunit